MKACALCGRLFPDEGAFCPVDGEPLRAADLVPALNVADDARLGRVLCQRYQLRRVVADGGMGRVYEALDMCDQRSVAVKVLHPDVATNDVALARFKREFAVSAELPHEHIVDVIEFRPTDDGSYAIVMEFLYGEELRATLKRRSVLPPARVVRILSQLAIGLDAAHARRLVHRDLKPDNIFLCQTSDGDIVKILDFGSVRDNTDSASRLTVLGTTIGSPYYMAPEQAQALDTLDHRADVWALAAIVYESITGQVPFRGNNGPSILLEILTGEPVVPSRAAEGKKYRVPRSVDAVLGRAFKKNPALRTSSVGALADDLGAAYGLEGRHADWAKTAEDELQRLIDERASAVLEAEQTPPTTDEAFFGAEALALRSTPAGATDPDLPSPGVASLVPAAPQSSAPAPALRARSRGLLSVLVVAVVALLVGVVLTILLAR